MINYTKNNTVIHAMPFLEFADIMQSVANNDFVNISPEPWNGNISFKDARKMALIGNDSLVSSAERLIDQISLANLPESHAYAWVPSVAGAYPCVPDYLGNSPTSMRTRKKVIRDTAPLRIFAGVTAPAYLTGEKLQKHFNALIAFSMLLDRFRLVELYIVQGSKNHRGQTVFLVLQIENRPLNLSQACFGLSVGAKRQLYFAYLSRRMDVSRSIPNVPAPSITTLETIGGTPEDIYFPTFTDTMSSGVPWIERMLTQYITTGQCSEASLIGAAHVD